ncbi:hypothetical protein BZM26_33335 [Paraburkholderia strydomiana]|nr:hypothetical protein BZM26_33335 [Paraburkholderia strydomiana]
MLTGQLSNTGLIQRTIAEGHQIANHTMTHLDLCRCELDEVRREILDLKWSIRWRVPRPQFGICMPPTEHGRTEWSLKRQRRGCRLLTSRKTRVTGLARRRCDCQHSAGLGPAWRNCALARRMSSRRARKCCHAGLRDQTLMALSRLIPALHDCGFVISSLPQPH